MSQCISNPSISCTTLPNLAIFTPNSSPSQSRLNAIVSAKKWTKHPSIKAMSGESRDNLDHLQRQNRNTINPQQPKRRSASSAPIGLWDRFPTARTVQQMMDTMERIVEDPLAYSTSWESPLSSRDGYSRGRTPWEIKEDDSDYKMRFDMPGMTKEDVKVWVEDKMLVVKAEKKMNSDHEANDDDGDDWSAKSYGKYSCRIALPENVEFEKIRAEVRDGVLYITIPKARSGSKIFGINVD